MKQMKWRSRKLKAGKHATAILQAKRKKDLNEDRNREETESRISKWGAQTMKTKT
jgi:ribosomal protein S30